VPVNVTNESGWDELALEQAMQRTSPSIGYLMPDFHNPTGRSMSAELRERVLAMAARQGTVLIADETMADMNVSRAETYLPFAGYDSARQAILIGSVGKSVWGGVRIGWIRAERNVIQRLVRARSAGDLGTPALEQLVVLNLLEQYDEILDQRRAYLREGRDYLEASLRSAFPEWQVPHVEGGLTAWVGLGEPVSSQLTIAARASGLLLAAGPRFGVDGEFERFIRIPFSYSKADTDRGIAALQQAWESLARGPMIDQNFLAEVV
jgi:DNA-binding transcriptional MocR family regulator